MADIKITELTALVTLETGDLLPIVDINDFTQAPSGSTRKVTIDLIQSFMQTNLTFLESGDNVSSLTNDAGYLTAETDPVFTASPASNVIDSGGGTLFLADDGTYKAVGGADGNGIYDGSGSLSGATTVTMATNNLIFSSTGDANLLKFDNTNNRLGIGETTPSAKLHVGGDTRVDGDVDINNTSTTAMDVGSNVLLVDTTNSRVNINGDAAGSHTLYINNASLDTNVCRMDTTSTANFFVVKDDEKIGIGVNPSADAVLELSSTDKSFILPRVTGVNSTALTDANGMLHYLTNTNGVFTEKGLWTYEDSAWRKVITGNPTDGTPIQGALHLGNGLSNLGWTQTAADPTTTEYPNTRDYGIHRNSSSGNIYLTYNDSGVIKKVQLT